MTIGPPSTYRDPVSYRNPFTYQHRSLTYNHSCHLLINIEVRLHINIGPVNISEQTTLHINMGRQYQHRSPFTYQHIPRQHIITDNQ